MYSTRVVVANELRSYREAIAQVFGKARPEVEVFAVEPEDLDEEVMRLRPDFVICSQVTPVVEFLVPVWVELYPDCQAHSKIGVKGETTTVDDVQLADLLAFLDQAQSLAALG